jgi:hypothetical protein
VDFKVGRRFIPSKISGISRRQNHQGAATPTLNPFKSSNDTTIQSRRTTICYDLQLIHHSDLNRQHAAKAQVP